MRLRQSGLACREIDGEMVVLDLDSSTYLTTNRTGGTLLRLLAEERTTEDLTAALVQEFGVPRSTAAADVETFLGTLRDKGLLEPAGQAGPPVEPRHGDDAP